MLKKAEDIEKIYLCILSYAVLQKIDTQILLELQSNEIHKYLMYMSGIFIINTIPALWFFNPSACMPDNIVAKKKICTIRIKIALVDFTYIQSIMCVLILGTFLREILL